MSKSAKIAFGASIALCVSSFATCLLGRRHAISQIPPEVRQRMSDTDWIGVEWVAVGAVLFFAGLALAVGTLALRYLQRHRHKTKNSI